MSDIRACFEGMQHVQEDRRSRRFRRTRRERWGGRPIPASSIERRQAADTVEDKTPCARQGHGRDPAFSNRHRSGRLVGRLRAPYGTGARCCCPRNRPGGCPTDLRTMALKALAL